MTQKTRADLTTEANTNLADNSIGDISPSDVRTMNINEIDSKFNLIDTNIASVSSATAPYSLTNTYSTGDIPVLNTLASSVTTTKSVINLIGRADSSNNAASINFYYAGAGSSSNYLGLGLVGNTNVLKILGSGAITISPASNAVVPLTLTQASGGSVNAVKINGTTASYSLDVRNTGAGNGLYVRVDTENAYAAIMESIDGYGVAGTSTTGTAGVYAWSKGTARASYHYRKQETASYAVVEILQDEALDNQSALKVTNDGTGFAIYCTATHATGDATYFSADGGRGCYAISVSGIGVRGISTSSYGGAFSSTSGAGIFGYSVGSGAKAAYLQQTVSSTVNCLDVDANTTVYGTNINNAHATGGGLAVTSNGTAIYCAGKLNVAPASNTIIPFTLTQASGGSEIAVDLNANNDYIGFRYIQNGTGHCAYYLAYNTGYAGYFYRDSNASTNPVVGVRQNSTSSVGSAFWIQQNNLDAAAIKIVKGTIEMGTYDDTTRPTAGTAGRIIYNTTDGNLNIDTGADWILPNGDSAT